MKINLRKANSVQAVITDALKATPVPCQVSIDQFQDTAQVVSAQKQTALESVQRVEGLTTALYSIRKSVGKVNAEAGISDLLAEVAELERRIRLYTIVSESGEAMPAEEISARVEGLKTADPRSLYRSDSVTTSVWSADEVAEYKSKLAELKRTKRDLQDKLLHMNVTTEITLNDQVVAVLQKAEII